MGWKRDLPDFRDYMLKSPKVEEVLQKSQPLKSAMSTLPSEVDLRPWCSPMEDQGNLGSCTANAGVGLMEYFQRRAFGKHLDASRLFLYKVTRKLEGYQGDTGAYLRTTMKAIVLFGIPPTKYWPYNVADFDIEPPAFCYSFAQSYKATRYYRLDPLGQPPSDTLKMVKTFLAAGLPSMFGFSVYSSIPDIGEGTGEIPFPQPGDGFLGGHAVVAIGYDDSKEIAGKRGALLIQNSWGDYWGEGGYGWLPYAYVEQGLAVDFWSLVDADFVDTDFFK
jgi:C1A family cysteine protease